MPKSSREQHEAEFSAPMLDEQAALPEIPEAPPESSVPEPIPASAPERKAARNRGSAQQAAPANEPFMPVKMTVGQYLKRQPQGEGISELIRSLHSTKIMSFGEWESTVKTLLKQKLV